MANKRYYWLKLKEDFFRQKEIKKLRRIAGGDTFTIIYLKMLLRSLKNDGRLYYDGIESNFISELALDIDEDESNVSMTVSYLLSNGILVQNNIEEYEILTAKEMTGSECDSAQRVRQLRKSSNLLLEETVKTVPKTNAERQRAFRAKQNTEKQQHIPMIEDYMNQKRYGGNYYLVCQREKFKCAICDSTENLCVHHIDGYYEEKPQNNATNKMILVCRNCHSKIHAGTPIPQMVLDSIGYSIEESNESNVTCNTEIEIEKREKSKEKDNICADALKLTPVDHDYWKFAKENAELAKAFYDITGIAPVKSQFGRWVKDLRDLAEAEITIERMKKTIDYMRMKDIQISGPGSILKTAQWLKARGSVPVPKTQGKDTRTAAEVIQQMLADDYNPYSFLEEQNQESEVVDI